MFRISFFIFLLISVTTVVSCKKKTTEPITNPPTSPPMGEPGDTVAIWTVIDETSGNVFSRITDIEQNGSGNIWISSFNGSTFDPTSKISAFDYSQNNNQVLDSNSTHFLKSKVTSLGFNATGSMHIGAQFENTPGLEKEIIIESLGTFTNYAAPTGQFLTPSDFENFYFNSDGLWYGSGSEWLVNFSNPNFDVYDNTNSNIVPPGTIQDIIMINANDFWFNTHNTLSRKVGNNFEVVSYIDSDAMDIDSEGNLWLAGGQSKLNKYNGVNMQEFDIPILFGLNIGISDVVCDSYDNIWVATGGTNSSGAGLFRFDGTNWTNFNSASSSLHSNSITKLLLDDAGNLWIGSVNAGVMKLNKFGTNN